MPKILSFVVLSNSIIYSSWNDSIFNFITSLSLIFHNLLNLPIETSVLA